LSSSGDSGANIRASVVDIADGSLPLERAYAVDANVVIMSTYDRYDQHRSLRERVPSEHQIDAYLRYESRARAAGCALWVGCSTVFEFLRTIEQLELRILWATRDERAAEGDWTGFSLKETRDVAREQYPDVQRRICVYSESVAKRYAIFDPIRPLSALMAQFAETFRGTMIDSGDALIVNDARAAGVSSIISNDVDLATVDGITLYTNNRRVIEAARAAAKLVRGARR
jgi:hypothetical protein